MLREHNLFPDCTDRGTQFHKHSSCNNAPFFLDLILHVLCRGTMSELRSYKVPPPLIHEVMKASLLLLGEDEFVTSVSTQINFT